MARGNVLTPGIKKLIVKVYLEHPEWHTRKIREEVINQYHQVSRIYDDPNWPGLSVIQKELAKIRKKKSELPPEESELDNPWDVGSLLKYNIPPQAIPTLLQIRKTQDDFSEWPLTIRQARWIGRLHSLTGDINRLMTWSRIYDFIESFNELTDNKLGTLRLDNIVFEEAFFLLQELMDGTTQIPDPIISALQKLTIQREEAIGLSLEAPDFTPNCYFPYIFWLGQFKSWSRESVLELRDSTEKNEQQRKERKETNIVMIIMSDLEFIEGMMKIVKEVYNERAHRKEG
jgi:hypothetical protein